MSVSHSIKKEDQMEGNLKYSRNLWDGFLSLSLAGHV